MVGNRIYRERVRSLRYDAEGLGLRARIVAYSRNRHGRCTHVGIVRVSHRVVGRCSQRRVAILHHQGRSQGCSRVGLVGDRINGERASSLRYNAEGLRLGTRIITRSRDGHGRCAHVRVIRVGHRVVCWCSQHRTSILYHHRWSQG